MRSLVKFAAPTLVMVFGVMANANSADLFVRPACIGTQVASDGSCAFEPSESFSCAETPCSIDQPCTLQTANQCVMPGDTVHLFGGRYGHRIRPARSGTQEAPIIYRPVADTTQTAVLTQSGGGQLEEGAINLSTRSHVQVFGRAASESRSANRLIVDFGEEQQNTFVNFCGGSKNLIDGLLMTGNAYTGISFCVFWWERKYAYSPIETAYNTVRNSTVIGRGQVLSREDCSANLTTTEDLISFAHNAHHNLLENNYFSNASHVVITFNQSPNTHHNVIRYNTIRNGYHTALDHWGGGHFGLIEGNFITASAGSYHQNGEPNDCPGNALQFSAREAIIRYNVISRGGSPFNIGAQGPLRGVGGLSISSATDNYNGVARQSKHNRIYNNTIVKNQGPGVVIVKENNTVDNYESIADNIFINNLIFDNNIGSYNTPNLAIDYEGLYFDGLITMGNTLFNIWDSNAIGNPGDAPFTIGIDGLIYSTDEFEQRIGDSDNLNIYGHPHFIGSNDGVTKPVLIAPALPEFIDTHIEEPGFVNYVNNFTIDGDYHLAEGSPMIDRAVPLTVVSTNDPGNGILLYVDDTRYFQDGMQIEGNPEPIPGVFADRIAVGQVDNSADIIRIDDENGILTLEHTLEREPNDAVWLVRNSRGLPLIEGEAPDVGACEYEDVCSRYRFNAPLDTEITTDQN